MENADNRKKKKPRPSKKGPSQASAPTAQRRHIVLDEIPVPVVHEPQPLCRICGQPIELIAEAISENDGGFSHFDCVTEKLRVRENVQEGEYLSYVGHGNFAVFVKNEEGRFVMKTQIPYESKESYESAKKFVEETKQ